MRTAPERAPRPRPGEARWFALALALGVLWGFSVEPVALPGMELPGAAQLKLLGWLVVAVLCLCLGAVGWLISGYGPAGAVSGGEMGFDNPQPTPRNPQLRPSFEPKAEPQSFAAGPGAPSVPATKTPAETPPATPSESKDPLLAALDYLGHSQATVRIGGLLALERAARRSGDLGLCAGVLGAYVQQWAAEDMQARRNRPGFDVVAALAVASRLLPPGDPARNLVDLRRTCLAGLELPDADLSCFHFEHADLSGADLRGTNLSGVNFRGAALRGSLLAGAVFSGASLRGADLTGAVLSDEEFGAADLSQAGNFSAANLSLIRYAPHLPPHLPPGMQTG